MTHKRENTFDIMKSIGIIAVIVGHFALSLEQFIFSWHMPLFFIIAGYFYRQRSVREQIIKDAKHLLFPYFLTCFVIIIFYSLLSCIYGKDVVSNWVIASLFGSGSTNHTSYLLSEIPPIGAIWFLWALFWCKFFFNLIFIFCTNREFICLLVSVLAILIDKYLINLPFAILPGISATLFYMIGFWVHKNGGFKSIKAWIIIICLVCWVFSFTYSNMSMVRCFYENYPLNVLGACGGVFFIYWISQILSKGQGWLINFLIWIGRNSMTFLCIHLIDLDVHTWSYLNVPYQFVIPYEMIICIIGTYILSKIPFARRAFSIC